MDGACIFCNKEPSGHYIPARINGKINPEYATRIRRAKGIPPREPSKFGVKEFLINRKDGRINPEYGKLAKWNRVGLNLEEAKLVYKSSNICAICKKSVSGMDKHLDHNHKTMKIRGILCGNCNRLLGCALENISTLQNAILYLEKTI